MQSPPDAERAYAALVNQLQAERIGHFRLVGIHSGGAWIAERLQRDLGLPGPIGTIDISFYRDDYDEIGLHAEAEPTSIGFDVAGASILLVDDVLYTGRTIRGAMNVLFDYGRPARIELAALVDRLGRQLPIEAHWVGTRIDLPKHEGLVLQRMRDTVGTERFAFTVEASLSSGSAPGVSPAR
ncbi:MAG: bifunctional pyr operon transcriptional regulator/uracil phosphoribosyltransferase PyrR [Burkholderiaceae bacterium]|jgi:pyrimidine operon attenuation protein/uracil phosphoribosyltransferase